MRGEEIKQGKVVVVDEVEIIIGRVEMVVEVVGNERIIN
jgi:hypothetical protein